MKSFFIFFLLMSMHEFFAASAMLFLASNPRELAVPLYNAAFIISNFILYFAYAELIVAAIGTHFESTGVGERAKKYYRGTIVSFGLIIIIVSAVYQARPVLDNETYLISANYDPFVYKMMVSILLISMGPASLLFIGKMFFIKENMREYAIMGIGIMTSIFGQIISESVQSPVHLILADTATILGFLALFYGISFRDSCRNIRANLSNI